MSVSSTFSGFDQPGGAFELCREALAEGATVTLADAAEPVEAVRDRYRRQFERSSEADGAPTVGFQDAVAALEATRAETLQTAYVQDPQSPWLFVVLADNTTRRAVACIAVNHPAAGPNDPFPLARQVTEDRWTTRPR